MLEISKDQVKGFKKYFIIPKEEIAFVVHSGNAEDAMSCFAWAMDSDMNTYFRAVTEEEYEEIVDDKKWEARRQTQIDFYIEELEDNFDDVIPEEDIEDVADAAYEIYCNAGRGKYCCVTSEYDALEAAIEEWWEENGKKEDADDEED